MKLILASNNPGKLKEMRELLGNADVELLSQRDAGCDFSVEETGETFEENAYLKAAAITAATGEAAVADDSGLMVRALSGAPGAHSARFTGSHEDSDEARNAYLLQKLEGETDRRAKFVSCICCTFPDGTALRTRGECTGSIALSPRGEHGFGYDPLFLSDDYPGRTMGELTAAEKNAVSHRSRAIAEFVTALAHRKGETGC
ncbi:MAG: RdgB/HAM1 family non-canonical purine NTP pyrophosphatase [Oscillospiraceae bacterium]|nr:RdgB/HAM1 family non-canonical purine NTP pyrophosphatase [Oscillospiraceae bacterium]